jgi:structural maintenance of chromosome 3 (chondroitin sulfate proteoglycan 6)
LCCPQIVQVADKVYGVSHTNKVSNVDPISRAYALEFLQAEEEQEQQRKQQQQQQHRQGRRAAPVAAG